METQSLRKGKAIETKTKTLEKENELETITQMEDEDHGTDMQIFCKPREPRFLRKLRKIVDDPGTDSIISWSNDKNSIIIWNKCEFSTVILPKFYKHGNYFSFIRQLNKHGFKKKNRDRDVAEYARENFRGEREANPIKNRWEVGGCSNPRLDLEESCLEAQIQEDLDKINKQVMEKDIDLKIEMDPSHLQAKIETLKNYTNTMKVEIMELTQQQQSITSYLPYLQKRIEIKNKNKRQVVRNFLEKTFANRVFFNHFTQLIREQRELGSGQTAKKGKPEVPHSGNSSVISDQVDKGENQNEEVVIYETNEIEKVADFIEDNPVENGENQNEEVVTDKTNENEKVADLIKYNQVENGENQNKEVITLETKENQHVLDLVIHESGPSNKQTNEEAVYWDNWDSLSGCSMLLESVRMSEMNYENEVRVGPQLSNRWQEEAERRF